MLTVFIHIFCLCSLSGIAGPPLQDEKVYTASEVSVKPQPLKGLDHFQKRWSRAGKYPQHAQDQGIQGMVFIEFIVNADGTITDAAVRKGIGYGCDEAALEAFREVAKEPWKPGMLRDKPVKVKMVLPYFFRIIKR